jgi:phosphohistidine swiveling domain-containing protein
MPLLLLKIYTREFPLILNEIWGRAYTDFLGVKLKTRPRQIFLINRGLVATYRNPQLDGELRQIFLERAKDNPRYLSDFYNESLKKFAALQALWNKDHLRRAELDYFIEEMILFWPAVYASVHLAGHPEFSDADQALMLRLRQKIDIAANQAADIIIRSLQHLYPDLGELAAAVSTGDFRHDKIDRTKLRVLFDKTFILAEGILVSDQELDDLKKKYDFDLEREEMAAGADMIKGQTACPGQVSGRVRLILRRNEMENMKEGEILVTTMTTPDFLPAMKKAAAFVTDEGGITCHAAIIAREMHKPCVIGTKVATKALQDGDRVEVDADKGEVRILGRVN